MAISNMKIRAGKSGTASKFSDYISRDGSFKNRKSDQEVLAKGDGNMPDFAKTSSDFWKAADLHERSNGSPFREVLLSLPRELSPEQNLELAKEWIGENLKGHPYSFAFHQGKASDDGENPHIHVMFSERKLDGIERTAEQFFKRANSKNPEKGGCPKQWEGNWNGGRLDKKAQSEALKNIRDGWEKAVNHALEKGNSEERISMKSYKEQGLEVKPSPKVKKEDWRESSQLREQALKKRKENRERIRAKADLKAELQQREKQDAEAKEWLAQILAREQALEKQVKKLEGDYQEASSEEWVLRIRVPRAKEDIAKHEKEVQENSNQLKANKIAFKELEDWEKSHRIRAFFGVKNKEFNQLVEEENDLREEKAHLEKNEERVKDYRKHISQWEEADSKSKDLSKELKSLEAEKFAFLERIKSECELKKTILQENFVFKTRALEKDKTKADRAIYEKYPNHPSVLEFKKEKEAERLAFLQRVERIRAEREVQEQKRQQEEKEHWTEKDTEAFFDRERKLAKYSNQWGGYARKQALREATADLKEKADYHRQRNPELDKQLRQAVKAIKNEVERTEGRGR